MRFVASRSLNGARGFVERISDLIGSSSVENGTANRSWMLRCFSIRGSIPDSVARCGPSVRCVTQLDSIALTVPQTKINASAHAIRYSSRYETELDCISPSDILNYWDKQLGFRGDARRPSFQPRNPITNRSIQVRHQVAQN